MGVTVRFWVDRWCGKLSCRSLCLIHEVRNPMESMDELYGKSLACSEVDSRHLCSEEIYEKTWEQSYSNICSLFNMSLFRLKELASACGMSSRGMVKNLKDLPV